MKQVMMMVLAMALSINNAMAQNESKADTLTITETNDIIIVQNDSIETVTSNPKGSEGAFDWDLDLVDRITHYKFQLSIRPQLEMGFQFVGGDDGGMFKGFGNAEMRYNFAQLGFFPKNSKWWYTLDLGLSYSQLAIKKDYMLLGDDDNNLSFVPFPAGVNIGAALLSTFGTDLKFLVHRQLGRYGSLGFGAMYSGHLNSSFALNTYRDEQDKFRSKMYQGMSRNNFSLRLEYAVDRKCRLYVDYAPRSNFKAGVGPQTSLFTVGVGLNF